ncbi:MAG: hypothetical protein AAF633_14785 [Chloroflexota bacterium]
MGNILIVCTANICRSPVVEALLRLKLDHAGYQAWQVYSAGTWVEESRRASRYSVELLSELKGIDISLHRSRLATPKLVRDADLVIVMTASHAEVLQIENPSQRDKIVMLSQLAYDGRRIDVQDPYGGPKEEYRIMFDSVSSQIDAAFDRIISMVSKP